MILKKAICRSDDIAELERLRDLAPAATRTAIEKQIRNIRSGAAGERSAAHFLDRELRASERLAVIHDLRIGTDGDFAQIDHLLIHRVQATAWVLETKNYAGRLSCDEHGDWTVWRNNKPQPIPSPVAQAQRQCRALDRWLEENGMPWIRRVVPVVLISPTSSVDRRRLPKDAIIVKSDNFAAWWQQQAEGLSFGTVLNMFARHIVSGMSEDDFKTLGERLVAAHVPADFDWQGRFAVPAQGALGGAGGSKRQIGAKVESGTESAATNHSEVVATPYGDIRIARIRDGHYTLRNEAGAQLIELVKKACRGRAQWNPRYRNWLVSGEKLPEVLAVIEQGLGSEPVQTSGGPSEATGTRS